MNDTTAGGFAVIDWAILAVYFAGTLLMGLAFSRKASSVEGFTAAGRSLPGWVCGLSIFATYLSSISYLALPGKSFAGNWNAFVFSLAIPPAAWIAVRYFVPYYRKSGEVSAYAALEHRFGVWARVCVAIFYLLTQIARAGVVMYLMALPMQVLLGWDIRWLIVGTGLAVTAYSMVGGIVAVIWADAVQAIVLMVGAVACLAMMLWAVPGGLNGVLDLARPAGKLSLGSTSLTDFTSPTILVVLLYGLVENLKNFGIDQSYVQRYIAADSDAAARRSLWLGGLLYVPVSALFFMIGTTLWTYHQTHAAELPAVRQTVARQRILQRGEEPTPPRVTELAATLGPDDIGDRVFPQYIVTHLPAGLRGLLIAAVFAAAMSTVSTSLNSSATLVLEDFTRRFIRRDIGEIAAMRVLRTATAAWGVLGTGTALLLVRTTQSALDVWWTLSAVFGGGMVGLFLLGIATKTRPLPAAIAAAAGLATIAALVFTPPDSGLWYAKLHSFMTAVVGTIVILSVGPMLNRLLGPGRPSTRTPQDIR